MKKCPYCAEEIQDEAIKCKHCGEFLDGSGRLPVGRKIPWYFRTSFIVIAVLCVGPLALPLIWWHPQASRSWKVGLTLGILALTYFLYLGTMTSMEYLKQYFDLMNEF